MAATLLASTAINQKRFKYILHDCNKVETKTGFSLVADDITSTVIRMGASIAKSASVELSVSVVSGYEFYLVKAGRR